MPRGRGWGTRAKSTSGGTSSGVPALTRRPSEGPGGGRMGRAGMLGLAIAALGLGEAACLVQITHVADPRPIFGEARAEAERLTGRPGRAHELNVLVWNRDDRELVRVSLPMWIVRKAERHIDWDDDAAFDGDRRAKDHVR